MRGRSGELRSLYLTCWSIICKIRIQSVNLVPLLLAYVADIIQPLLVTSAKHHRYPCSRPQPTQWAIGNAFQNDWQIDYGFLKGQSWRVLKSWYTGGGSEQGFQRCFTDELNQNFSSVGGASYITLSALRSSDFEFPDQKSDFPTEILLVGANSILRAPVIISLLTTRRRSNSIPWCIFPEASRNIAVKADSIVK